MAINTQLNTKSSYDLFNEISKMTSNQYVDLLGIKGILDLITANIEENGFSEYYAESIQATLYALKNNIEKMSEEVDRINMLSGQGKCLTQNENISK
ncbi:hypothetical protein [Actinobacillus delphinicola]|uniref:Uncharacterized protein n=1 Tax=Actinobacillus delphinicola TaxID=51161 RepID=A0A448TV39_9PAST|nr:hypothetical protein [Actinobacillus delphinicola]VEJ09801.1 Uncharacterised protein [Actinobacillus delphinicola]